MATEFPTFVDVPEGEEPEPGTPLVDADYLNSVNLAVNTIENSLPGYVDAGDLATVATTGAYTDLIGTPFIPTEPDDIGAAPAGSYQTADADLTAIAALSPTNNDVLQRKSGAWTNRTPAQLKTDLALAKGDVGLGDVDNTSDANKPISTATQTALDTITTSITNLNIGYINSRLTTLDSITEKGNLSSAAVFAPDDGGGGTQTATLTQDCTITFSEGLGDGKCKMLELVLTQDSTGGWVVNWGSTIRWEGGTAPTLSTTPGAIDRLVFMSVDNGVTWFGDVVGLGYA